MPQTILWNPAKQKNPAQKKTLHFNVAGIGLYFPFTIVTECATYAIQPLKAAVLGLKALMKRTHPTLAYPKLPPKHQNNELESCLSI